MKRLIFTSIFYLFNLAICYTQNNQKKLREANYAFEIGNYFKANSLYNNLYEQDSTNAVVNFNLAVSYYHIREYEKATELILKSNSSISVEYYRYKAALHHLNNQFEEAMKAYNKYKSITKKKALTHQEIDIQIAKVSYAQTAIKNNNNAIITNMGNIINSIYDDYVPLISADESMLFFTSRKPTSTGKLVDINGRWFEDIYVSHKQNDNEWTCPVPLNKNINTPTNDACAGLAPDGQTLFIFRTSEDLISGDLYECRMGVDDWSLPIKLPNDINSKFVESSVSITLDENTLYFSSNREGGYGGKDIYKSTRLPNGNWGDVVNLGAIINTSFDEDAPFISADGKTLYFSSTGHQNMGGFDIFKSELEDNKWDVPVNLGHPINTVNDDVFFVLTANESIGYYSSSMKGGFGGQDVYRVVLKNENTPPYVVKAKINAKENNYPPTETKITLIETISKKVQGVYKSNPITGKFILLIEKDKAYQIIIEAKGFYPLVSEIEFDVVEDTVMLFTLNKIK